MRDSSASSSGDFSFARKLQLNFNSSITSRGGRRDHEGATCRPRFIRNRSSRLKTISISAGPAPRKKRVLPVSGPAIAASRGVEVAAANIPGGVEWPWQVETVSSSSGRSEYALSGAEWRPPVKEAHRSVGNGFRKGCRGQRCQQRAHPGCSN